jgi:hypothetical protein
MTCFAWPWQGSWRIDCGHSDALSCKELQKELFFWVSTQDANGSIGNGNCPENLVSTTQGYDTEESKALLINSTASMAGMDAQAAPPALYRICESRLYRANVQDSSSIEFSFQVITSWSLMN